MKRFAGRLSRIAAGGMGWLAAGLLLAQNPPQNPPDAKPADPPRNAVVPQGSPLLWQVDLIMTGAAKQITRTYNLNPQQEEFTRKLMTQRVKKFLSNHEADVRVLADEFMAYQSSTQMPPPEAAREFARRARPLLSSIHREIVEGNMQWREILTDDQKKLHDRDLRFIDDQFKRLDDRFDRWSHGDVEPGDLPSLISKEPRTIMKSEDAWEYFVRRFIQDYRLDEAQQESARSVLRELQQEAAAYRESRRQEFDAMDAKYKEFLASASKNTPEDVDLAKARRRKLDAERGALEQPIAVEMFNRLKQKLQAIPRADQRQRFQKHQAEITRSDREARQAFARRLASSRPADTRPAVEPPASAPADVAPATAP